ncbi:MAG: hypothetical protein ACFFAE_08695, partial [Candidatus Hodarchaeota archaeon]
LQNHFSLIIVNQAELGSSSSSLRFLVNQLTNFRIVGFIQVTNSNRLEHVCKNLQLKEVVQLEEAVTPLERSHIQHYSIPLPQEYFFILEILDQIRTHELDEIGKLGFDVSSKSGYREITAIHESLKKDNNPKALIRVSNLLRIMVLQKIVISQGFPAVHKYFNTIRTRVVKEQDFQGRHAIIEFLNDMKIQKLRYFISIYKHLQHPKVQMLQKLISQYEVGISIVSHNYYNSTFLKDYLSQQEGFSVIQIEEPISSMSDLHLQRAILPFSEKKVNICITNTIHELIARNAQVIIAYDVNAGIVESLNSIDIDIPKVFLLAKQTNEEARFFYLKRLGSRFYHQDEKMDLINENLHTKLGEPSRVREKNDTEDLSHPKTSLAFNVSLFELGIPYLFSKKEYSILSNDNLSFPGFILDQKVCFLLFIPATIDFFLSLKPHQLFSKLVDDFQQIHLIFFSHSFTNLSFDFRCDLLHAANRHNVCISFLTKEKEIPELINRMVVKPQE